MHNKGNKNNFYLSTKDFLHKTQIEEKRGLLPIVIGIVSGCLTYLLAPGLLGINTELLQDEMLGGSVALIAYFVSSMKAPVLCSTSKQQKRLEKWNIVRGGIAGGFSGTSLFIGLLSAGLVVADFITTGGIITGFTIGGAASAYFYNKLKKTKECDHCHGKDSCKHVVCRNDDCYRLHVPFDIAKIDCDMKTPGLTWFMVASIFHEDGLNYLESLRLAEDNYKNWEFLTDKDGNQIAIDCDLFMKWRKEKIDKVYSYIGSVKSPSEDDLKHLDSLDKNNAI